jgi:hypothetical protein
MHSLVEIAMQPLNDEDGWEDEEDNSDWVKTPIKIKVPFHKRSLHPGQKEFDVGTLHHRKLVSVIREKIMRPSSHHTSISSHMSYFGNQLKLLNHSKFMESSTPQKHSSRLTMTFRNLLESLGVTFRRL